MLPYFQFVPRRGLFGSAVVCFTAVKIITGDVGRKKRSVEERLRAGPVIIEPVNLRIRFYQLSLKFEWMKCKKPMRRARPNVLLSVGFPVLSIARQSHARAVLVCRPFGATCGCGFNSRSNGGENKNRGGCVVTHGSVAIWGASALSNAIAARGRLKSTMKKFLTKVRCGTSEANPIGGEPVLRINEKNRCHCRQRSSMGDHHL